MRMKYQVFVKRVMIEVKYQLLRKNYFLFRRFLPHDVTMVHTLHMLDALVDLDSDSHTMFRSRKNNFISAFYNIIKYIRQNSRTFNDHVTYVLKKIHVEVFHGILWTNGRNRFAYPIRYLSRYSHHIFSRFFHYHQLLERNHWHWQQR